MLYEASIHGYIYWRLESIRNLILRMTYEFMMENQSENNDWVNVGVNSWEVDKHENIN